MAIKRIVIATIKSWNIENAVKFEKRYRHSYKTSIFANRDDVSFNKLKEIHPQYVFFPHWSRIIPRKIYENFECIVFHMTDLPFGRGGSPLQNLILSKIVRTRISAIKAVGALDAGPVYLKRNLSLRGSAQEIYRRASDIIFKDMIPQILRKKPNPAAQKGKAMIFKRRRPEESRIPVGINLDGIYDYIRMLDGEGYPPAFMESGNLCFEFNQAIRRNNSVEARVLIKLKEKK